MQNKFKLLALILAVVMTVSAFAACTEEIPDTDTDTSTETTPDTGNDEGTEAGDGTEADGNDTEAGGNDTEADSDNGTEADGDNGTEADSDNDTEADSDDDTEADSDNETEDNGGHETEDNGGNETEDNGGNETEDNGGNETEDNGGNETEDNGGHETEDNGGHETEDNGGNETEDNGGNETESSTQAPIDPENCNHYDKSNWTGKPGTLEEVRVCADCGTVVANRPTEFSLVGMNVEQSYNQSALRIPGGSALVDVNVSNSGKIVIPTSSDYDIVIKDVVVTAQGGVANGVIYYSVDGGTTWHECSADPDSLTVALTGAMFTGNNAGNVDLALENGVVYAFVPGYNKDYVTNENLSSLLLQFIRIPAGVLSNDTNDSGGHHGDPSVLLTMCEHANSSARKAERTDNGDGTVTYTYKCSECDKTLGTSGKVPSDIKFYSSPISTFYYDNVVQGANRYMNIGVQGGVVFTRAVPSSAGATMNIFPASCKEQTINIVPGKYLVIKYRASGEGLLGLYVQLGNGTAVDKNMTQGATDGWVVAVMDISGYSGFSTTEAQKLTVTLVPRITVDLAYVAVADDIEDVHTLLLENETYFYRGDSFTNAGVECDKNGCVGAHSVKTNAQTGETVTTYTYTCAACGDTVADPREIPNALTYYWSPSSTYVWDNNRPEEARSFNQEPTAMNNEVFVRVTPVAGGNAMALYPFGKTALETPLGRYLAIKYRLNRVDGVTSEELRCHLMINGNGPTDQVVQSAITDDWVTAVMDISEFPGYDADKVASGTAQSILLYFTTRMEMDVAYVAMFNEIDDIKALLGENETYFYRGNSFANAGVECDKNGCVSTHSVKIDVHDGEASTTYTYTCSACGASVAASREIPKTVAHYWNPSQSRMYDNNAGGYVYHDPIANGGEAYVNFKPRTGGMMTESEPILKVTTALGKYLAVKYRYTSMDGIADTNLYLNVTIGTSKTTQTKVNAITDDWVVAVVDISGFVGYDDNKASTTLTVSFTHRLELDIAYVAIADDLNDIRTLINDDTYTYCGENFASAGETFKTNGVCTTSHTGFTWTAVAGTTTEQRTCSACELSETRETVIYVLGGIYASASNPQNTLTVGSGKGLMVATTTSTSGSIVIPVTAEDRIKMAPVYVSANGGVVGDHASSTGGAFYSVDGGETWHWLSAEGDVVTFHVGDATNVGVVNAGERSMAVPLDASMFTGDNARNVALALENGVLYGMVPGYNSDYVDGKTVTDTAAIVPFLLIPADILVAAS